MPTPQQLSEGRQRLQDLLPEAIERAKSENLQAITGTSVADALSTALTIDKFHSLVVHEGEQGGWVCDLILHDMPPGLPTVLGTPVSTPFKTREEALASAPELLTYMTKLATQPKKGETKPVFEFHNLNFTLHPEMLNVLIAHGIREEVEASYCFERLREITETYFPDECSKEIMDALDRKTHLEILYVIHMASALGIFRYPQPEAQPPHTEH